MSCIYPTILRIISPTIGNPFGLSYGGGVLIPPSISEDLLVWLKGNDNGTDLKLDSWLNPDAENWAMSGAYCASLNGVDEYGIAGVIPSIDKYCTDFWFEYEDSLVTQTVYGRHSYDDSLQVHVAGAKLTIQVYNYKFVALEGVLPGLHHSVVKYKDNLLTVIFDSVLVHSETIVLTPVFESEPWFVGTRGDPGDPEFSGKIFNSSIHGVHFRIAEGPGDGTNLTSFSDDYQTDGMSIAWTAAAGTLWAQRQDIYFGNALAPGWWEITGDDVLYPYPVAGFDTHHEGGTFNSCEVSYGPEEGFVGTFNGVDDSIQLLSLITLAPSYEIIFGIRFSRIDIDQKIFDSTGVRFDLTYSATTNEFTSRTYISNIEIDGVDTYGINDTDYHIIKITGISTGQQIDFIGMRFDGVNSPFHGIIRNANIDGTLIPIDEGEGTDIRDSDGNVVGTLNGDPAAFYGGQKMVSDAVIAMEAASTSGNFYTDGFGHSLPMTEQAWEELGPELVENGQFIYWTDPTIPDGWDQGGTPTATNYIEESPALNLHMVSDGSSLSALQAAILTTGLTYRLSGICTHVSLGGVTIRIGGTSGGEGGSYITIDSTGLFDVDLVSVGHLLEIARSGSCDITFDNISVREVNQVINQNKQYYFCPLFGLFNYKIPRTTEQHLDIVEFMYNQCDQLHEALHDEVSGELTYDEETLEILFDEEA